MYKVLGLAAVFHKLIEENWIKFFVEISLPFNLSMVIRFFFIILSIRCAFMNSFVEISTINMVARTRQYFTIIFTYT